KRPLKKPRLRRPPLLVVPLKIKADDGNRQTGTRQGMKLTEQEIEMIETFREWSADRTGIRFTASSVDGVWEWDNVLAEGDRWRGVGTSFLEAFANL
ncbi:MAG: hypothetical protein WA754_22870, partial [Pseudolabrys sp.]